MAFEIPTDLIRQTQLAFRKESGFPDYDPDDPTLPQLPSLASWVAGLDPSPSHPRCKNCKGRLLRGPQSAICIYCGRQLSGEEENVSPGSMSFNSTVAYRWLLDSLHLNGSEITEQLVEGGDANGGQREPQVKKKLSDLLDIKITCSSQSKEPEDILSTNAQKNSSNFSGIDFNNFFSGPTKSALFKKSEVHAKTESKIDIAESQQDAIQERKIETTESKRDANWHDLSLFQKEEISDIDPKLAEGNEDDFSGWEADFQSSGFGNQHENTKSCDSFVRSTNDLSSHFDAVFETGSSIDEKRMVYSVPPRYLCSDMLQNEQQSNLSDIVPKKIELHSTTDKAKDDYMPENFQDLSSFGVDWFQDDQFQANDKITSECNAINEEDDSFGEWNDFKSFVVAQDFSKEGSKEGVDQVVSNDRQISETGLFSMGDSLQDLDFGSFCKPDVLSGSHSTQIDSVGQSDFFTEFSTSEGSNVAEPGGKPTKNGDLLSTSAQTKDDLEMLMSQMHDLSFMLEGNLSIPSKSDSVSQT